MKEPCRAFLLSFSSLMPVVAAQAPAPVASTPPGFETITSEDLLAHARWLADDRRRGRLTGTPEQLETARYIAHHFEELGLEPLGDEVDGKRGYLQSYPIVTSFLADGSRIEIGDHSEDTGFAVLPTDVPDRLDLRAPFVLVSPRGDVPDLHDAIPVVMLAAPPLRKRSVTVAVSTAIVPLRISADLARRLHRHGARAVVFALSDDDGVLPLLLNYVALQPGKPLLACGGDRGMAGMVDFFAAPVPRVFLSASLSRRLLKRMGVPAAEPGNDPTTAASAEPVSGRLALDVQRDADAHATNVVAVLRGSDPELARQAVIYSAHMDHLGVRLDGEVFNGADDNASGTAGLLETAQAYVEGGARPRRSVVFLSVSGEELGLWGSHWFSEHPTWPRDDIVADVNVDMIGRSGPESGPHEVTVTPSYRNDAFNTLVQDAARHAPALGLSFIGGDKYWIRSDHYNFARLGIPVVFFCNGEHEDYHMVSDEADRLDGAKMQTLARLAFWVGYDAAQADARPETLGAGDGWTGQ